MPFKIEHWGKGKGIVVNAATGKHYSDSPIPLVKAKAQMRLLQAVTAKKEDSK